MACQGHNISNSFSECAMQSRSAAELMCDGGMHGNASELEIEETQCGGFVMIGWGFILSVERTGLSGTAEVGAADTNRAEIESRECGGLETEGLVI